MSRIGKKSIMVPKGVKVEQSACTLKAQGPMGNLQVDCHPDIAVKIDNETSLIVVENPNPQNRLCRALHGTMRALINNMIIGVSKGFEKKLEIYGTGYGIKEQAGELIFQVGFSHPVTISIPKDINVKIEVPATRGNDTPAKFTLSGADKHLLGQFAADVRKIKPPEPYKGKGIRYADEVVRRKVGKAFASGPA